MKTRTKEQNPVDGAPLLAAPMASRSRSRWNPAGTSASPWTNFTLQQNTNSIGTVNWNNVLTTPTDERSTKTVLVNPATGNRFFRLKSQ